MGVELITVRHAGQIAGVLGCWDRMLVFGTLPKICFAGGMTSLLYERQIRIFDYPKFAEPYRNRIRENAERRWLLWRESKALPYFSTMNNDIRRHTFFCRGGAGLALNSALNPKMLASIGEIAERWLGIVKAARHAHPSRFERIEIRPRRRERRPKKVRPVG